MIHEIVCTHTHHTHTPRQSPGPGENKYNYEHSNECSKTAFVIVNIIDNILFYDFRFKGGQNKRRKTKPNATAVVTSIELFVRIARPPRRRMNKYPFEHPINQLANVVVSGQVELNCEIENTWRGMRPTTTTTGGSSLGIYYTYFLINLLFYFSFFFAWTVDVMPLTYAETWQARAFLLFRFLRFVGHVTSVRLDFSSLSPFPCEYKLIGANLRELHCLASSRWDRNFPRPYWIRFYRIKYPLDVTPACACVRCRWISIVFDLQRILNESHSHHQRNPHKCKNLAIEKRIFKTYALRFVAAKAFTKWKWM